MRLYALTLVFMAGCTSTPQLATKTPPAPASAPPLPTVAQSHGADQSTRPAWLVAWIAAHPQTNHPGPIKYALRWLPVPTNGVSGLVVYGSSDLFIWLPLATLAPTETNYPFEMTQQRQFFKVKAE